jgi:transcriptional adapter 2-alpha
MEKKRSKDEKEIVSRMRMFARFHSNDEHEALVKGLVQARRLRKQIELFQTYRSMGVRTLEGVRQYEVDRQRREKDSNYQKLRESAPHLYPSTTSAGAERGARHRGNLEAPPGLSGRNSTEVSTSENGLPFMLQADVMRAPGAEHLSDAELELCKTVPLLPLHYLAAKDAIIRLLFLLYLFWLIMLGLTYKIFSWSGNCTVMVILPLKVSSGLLR